MNRIPLIVMVCTIVAGCELIVIGTKRQETIEINQMTPIGAIFLFKAELDSSNIPAATQLMAHPNGVKYLAYEKYELYDEIARLGRIISKKPVTGVRSDSLASNQYKVQIELDYIKTLQFTTARIEDRWFITGYSD